MGYVNECVQKEVGYAGCMGGGGGGELASHQNFF